MGEKVFIHNDPDCYHDNQLSLHDCVAEKISLEKNIINFTFPNGIWVTTNHEANCTGNIVRTDLAEVDFCIGNEDNPDDIELHIYTQKRFKKTVVDFWNIDELIQAVNSKKCSIEFLYQYRTNFEQMWQCVLHFKKKPYSKDCYLHIPNAEVKYKWNNLREDRIW